MGSMRAVLGIDFGSHSIKLVYAERKGRTVRIRHAEAVRNAAAAETGRLVERVLWKWNMTTAHVALGLAGPQVLLKTLEIHGRGASAVARAVAEEINAFGELTEEGIVHDYRALPDKGGSRRALLAMVRASRLAEALHIPDRLGLEVVDCQPQALALFNALRAQAKKTAELTVYADIGQQGTEVAIGGKEGLLFTRRFDIGGLAFTRAIAEELEIDELRAEDLKLRCGLPPATGDAAAQRALLRTADEWLKEFQATLTLFRNQFGVGAEITPPVLLAGGGAQMAGLDAYLGERLQGSVHGGERLQFDAGLAVDARFAVAAGLCLAALQVEPLRLSLLPAAHKETIALHHQKPFWAVSGGLCACALIALTLGARHTLQDRTRQLQQFNARLQTYRELEQHYLNDVSLNVPLSERVAWMRTFADNGPLARVMLEEVGLAKAPRDWITRLTDAHTYFSAPRGDAEASLAFKLPDAERDSIGGAGDLRHIVAEGYTPEQDFSSVRAMIKKIQTNPLVETADLLGDDKVVADEKRDEQWKATGAHKFAVVITLRKTAP